MCTYVLRAVGGTGAARDLSRDGHQPDWPRYHATPPTHPPAVSVHISPDGGVCTAACGIGVLLNVAASPVSGLSRATLEASSLAAAIGIPLGAAIAFLVVGVLLARYVFPRLEGVIDHVPRVGSVSIQPRDEVRRRRLALASSSHAY